MAAILSSAIGGGPSATAAVSAFGPLTTAFAPPAYCASGILICTGVNQCVRVERDQTCGSDGFATRASACFPSGQRAFQTGDADANYLYSPGIACPVGWASRTSTVDSGGRTRIGCCPSDLPLAAGFGTESCASPISYTSAKTTAFSCVGTSAVQVTLGFTSGQNTFVSFWARQVQMVLDPSLPFTTFTAGASITPSSSPASRSASATLGVDSGSASASATGGGGDGGGGGGGGISGGAIAGIVIGVLALLIIAAAIFFLRRRKQKKRLAAAPPVTGTTNPHQYNDGGVPELPGNNTHPAGYYAQGHEKGIKGPVNNEMTMAHHAGAYSEPAELYAPAHAHATPSEIYTPTMAERQLAPTGSPPLNQNQLNYTGPANHTPEPWVPTQPVSAPYVAPIPYVAQEMPEASSPRDTHPHPYSEPLLTPQDRLDRDSASSPVGTQSVHSADRLTELEANKAALEERMSRMKHISRMEEEHASMQAEIERLRAQG